MDALLLPLAAAAWCVRELLLMESMKVSSGEMAFERLSMYTFAEALPRLRLGMIRKGLRSLILDAKWWWYQQLEIKVVDGIIGKPRTRRRVKWKTFSFLLSSPSARKKFSFRLKSLRIQFVHSFSLEAFGAFRKVKTEQIKHQKNWAFSILLFIVAVVVAADDGRHTTRESFGWKGNKFTIASTATLQLQLLAAALSLSLRSANLLFSFRRSSLFPWMSNLHFYAGKI